MAEDSVGKRLLQAAVEAGRLSERVPGATQKLSDMVDRFQDMNRQYESQVSEAQDDVPRLVDLAEANNAMVAAYLRAGNTMVVSVTQALDQFEAATRS